LNSVVSIVIIISSNAEFRIADNTIGSKLFL
jgi:hypothetical protein